MPLLVMGLNHHTAPVGVRERLAVPSQRLPEILRGLKKETGILEVVFLSTCNRFETYFHARDVSAARTVYSRVFRPALGDRIPESYLYAFADSSATRHLFRVASGLDSMVVGENEVLGQLKQAYLAARAAGTTGKLLNVLFQRSLYIGKRVRNETGISRGGGSVASLAVRMAERVLGCLKESRVMILGAGEIAELTARHLLTHGVRSMIVSNRTYHRACALAESFGGVALCFEEGIRRMAEADIVVCSTAAPHPIIQPEQVREMMTRRGGRSLIFIDIAMPRDVHPDVHCIENVHVYDIDDLQAVVDQHLANRQKEMRAAEAIVEEKTEEFQWWLEAYRNGRDHSLRHYGPLQSARNCEDSVVAGW